MTYTRVDLTQYVVISICFSCNNDCSICMLSGLKRKFPAIGFDRFKKVIIDIVNSGRFENLILSGAEVTTFNDLDKYVQFAASLGWFKKIQVQTNGRRLSEKGYLRHLIDGGVNEFFISIHGLDDVHDAITRMRGSFKETREGLKNLEAFDVNVISNTVLTKTNLHDMARLMTFLSNERISEIQLWNFFPMERTDTKDLVVSMKDFTEVLPEILSIVKRAGKPLVLKSFPECLSMGEPGFFDSLFPVTVLPDVFWRKFSESGFGTCIYRQREECKAWKCWGLSSAYVQKYGDERNLLKPMM
ncbi:MAG: radical SAM protein [Deltaproteobacteria bacterium]|jgi:MoaA/NifB/PqqE/SkfB family radical SAM enzyme